ncbi:hypothetical protein DFH06DRAFT_671932 [Mycena polygramma]|nr:hypothetical protein DFH06DRAFT_671932 [Mycena polygramma]
MLTAIVSVRAPHIRACGKHHVSAEIDAASALPVPTNHSCVSPSSNAVSSPSSPSSRSSPTTQSGRTKSACTRRGGSGYVARRMGSGGDVATNCMPPDRCLIVAVRTRALYPSSAQGRSIPAVLIRLPNSSAAPLVFSPTPSSQAPRQSELEKAQELAERRATSNASSALPACASTSELTAVRHIPRISAVRLGSGYCDERVRCHHVRHSQRRGVLVSFSFPFPSGS